MITLDAIARGSGTFAVVAIDQHQPRAFVFRAVDGAGRIPAQSA